VMRTPAYAPRLLPGGLVRAVPSRQLYGVPEGALWPIARSFSVRLGGLYSERIEGEKGER
jgi:hypothetical protein